MYKLRDRPDKSAIWQSSGSKFKPIMTLSDKYGGRAQITRDDGCLVVLLKQTDGTYKPTPWIFPEAEHAIHYYFDR